MQYNFEWDPEKDKRNRRKHGVAFDQAATVFRDPRSLSLFDSDHNEDEDRWMTLGLSGTGKLLIVNHTFDQINAKNVNIRIFSSRKAVKREIRQYSE